MPGEGIAYATAQAVALARSALGEERPVEIVETPDAYIDRLAAENAPLRRHLERCAAELRQLHSHHYPGCGGGCPSDAYIAEAARLLGKEPKDLHVW